MAKKQSGENNVEKIEAEVVGKAKGGKSNIDAYNKSLTQEERIERARKAGQASAIARREKKTMKETMKTLMSMPVVGDNNRQNLTKFGIPEEDQNYQTAIAVRMVQKALIEGDTTATRLITELMGETGFRPAFGAEDNSIDVVDVEYPTICMPNNGRDELHGNILTPQAGPQTQFMASQADIVIYGGAAGGGKTWALLMEGLRHKSVANFGGVIFRKNYNQITAEGGLWDASHKLYGQVQGAYDKKTPRYHWEFDGGSGGKISFAHLEDEKSLNSWQGSEICYIGFDELTHFTKHQFIYMLSRNRSTCGVKPYVRATCNPDSDSWVASFISWWIDQDTGYPIKERSGAIRWMVTLNDVFYWGDSPEELAEKYDVELEDCKSVTFIASKLTDNKILMKIDPGYMANLKALTEVDKERLLNGNWKIKASAGRYFKRTQVEFISAIPNDIVRWCRAWDFAATDKDENDNADYTASVLLGLRKNGTMVILDVVNQQIKAGDVEKLLKNTSIMDKAKYGAKYIVRIPQDPGAAGKILAKQYIKLLTGFNVKCEAISGDKELRATPLATQWQNGNIQVLIAPWNEEYISQMESFPESSHDDMVDASSDAFSTLAEDTFSLENLL